MSRITALANSSRTKTLTAKSLLESGIVGLWANRRDIKNSATFARQLRVSGLRRGK